MNRQHKKEEKEILNDIKRLNKQLNNQRTNIDNITKILKEKQHKLEEIYNCKINGHLLRSRAIHVEYNETKV